MPYQRFQKLQDLFGFSDSCFSRSDWVAYGPSCRSGCRCPFRIFLENGEPPIEEEFSSIISGVTVLFCDE